MEGGGRLEATLPWTGLRGGPARWAECQQEKRSSTFLGFRILDLEEKRSLTFLDFKIFATETHMLSVSCRSGNSCAGIVDWGAAARKGACFRFYIFKKNMNS